MGQRSSPAARAERLAAAALWSQRVVPVREVVTCPPRARVRTRAARAQQHVAARVASPHSLLPRRVATVEPSDRAVWLGSDSLPMVV